MWANAQHDGRPAEDRWNPLFNAAKSANAHYYSAVQFNAAKRRNPLKFTGVPQTRRVYKYGRHAICDR